MAHIVELQPEVIRQLRASLNITTLQQCVEELVANALDADASQIDIGFDAEKYTVRVDDDGTGIIPNQLTHLCKRNVTSKCKTLDDLRHVHTFGYRGQALASLADIAIVQIISRFHQAEEVRMGIWKDGKLLETSLNQPRQRGTTVIVRDLFYKFPVRRRFLVSVGRISESIRRWVITMALAFPHIGFTLQDRDTKILVTKKRSSELNILHRLYGYEFAQNIRSFEYNDDTDVKLRGLFGITPYPSKNQQFIYINRHPIGSKHSLYQAVIETFAASSIVAEKSKKGKGVIEKHPIFLIHIEDPNLSSYDISLYLLDEHKVYPKLQNLVRQLVANFLRTHNFISSAAYKQLVHLTDVPAKRKKTSFSSVVVASPSWLYETEESKKDAINFIDRSRLRKTLSRKITSEITKRNTATKIDTSMISTPTVAVSFPQQRYEGPAVRLSKEDLKDAQVLGQIDNKFILIKLNTNGRQLLLVDQHAADERVQLERMLWSLKDTTEATQLDPSIAIDLSSAECRLAQKYAAQLDRWGFRLSIALAASTSSRTNEENEEATPTVILRYSEHFSTRETSSHFEKKKSLTLVTRLPRLIADRCIVNKDILRDLICEYLHSLDRIQEYQNQVENEVDDDQEINSFTFLHGCPHGMMSILRSKACRGAVMFNDSLTMEQCRWLIQALSNCRFPFQCVHGRPSMVPLVALDANTPRRHRINWGRFNV
ncbi:hypothetical protein BDC45DRAFT_570237 [Circinella umbellata]|nr:hypothetical protein BDC45DRAFT_570237 [Circinella umbellata]